MYRRQFTAASGSLLVAGCTGGPQNGESNEDTPNKTTSEETTTDSNSVTATETETPTEQAAPSIRLQVLFDATVTATLTLERLTDNEVIFQESKEYADGESVNLTDQFEPNTDYRFSISNADGKTIWDREIGDYEGYVLEVKSKTKVEIESHTEY